jgi:hypothetical protein
VSPLGRRLGRIPSPYPPVRLTTTEAEELEALVTQGWELRGTPYTRDAAEAIVAWRERLALSRLERRQRREAANAYWTVDRLIALLRETDPEPGRRRQAEREAQARESAA